MSVRAVEVISKQLIERDCMFSISNVIDTIWTVSESETRTEQTSRPLQC